MRTLPATVVLAVIALATTACRAGGQPRAGPEGSSSSFAGPANGISALPAKEIARRAGQAIHGQPVHVRGTVSDGAAQVTALDVIVGTVDDGRCTVVEAGETVEAVRVGGQEYVRASANVWAAVGLPGGTTGRAEGKYVRAATRSPQLSRLTKFLDVSRVLADELAATETATVGGTAIINGVPTVAITPVTPGLSPLPIGTIYVATVGEPYVIRWVSPGDVGRLDFSDYAKPVAVDAPPPDQVVDVEDLMRP